MFISFIKRLKNSEKLTNVQLLIAAGADVNGTQKTNDGNSLYQSMVSDCYDITYYLLQKGANPELEKDSIIDSMSHGFTRNEQRENKAKVKKMLEARGFDFSKENLNRINEERNQRVKAWMEKLKAKRNATNK